MGAGELGDISGGDVIAAGFTNNVKDRTAMRYASAASRDSIITSPVEGSLAYLQDENTLTMYDGTNWVLMVQSSGLGEDKRTPRILLAEARNVSVSPGITTNEIISFETATAGAFLVITVRGSGNNQFSQRVIFSYHTVSASGFQLETYGLSDLTTTGTCFYDIQVVEYFGSPFTG